MQSRFPFTFIKYTQPAWQYNVVPKVDIPVASAFYHPILQPLKSVAIEEDNNYETDVARWADIGYQCWQGGFLITSSIDKYSEDICRPSIKDEYYFIAKYADIFFTCFAFACRLFSLNNPIKESLAFFNSSKVTKNNLFNYLDDLNAKYRNV